VWKTYPGLASSMGKAKQSPHHKPSRFNTKQNGFSSIASDFAHDNTQLPFSGW
jgi:hypothetical protein